MVGGSVSFVVTGTLSLLLGCSVTVIEIGRFSVLVDGSVKLKVKGNSIIVGQR